MTEKRYPDSPLGPASSAVAVTPSDATVLDANGTYPRALFVGVGGDLVLDMVDGQTDVTFKNVQSGQVLDVVAKRVKVATSATNIVALF